VQKRRFLRAAAGPAGLARGFLLDRARFVVVPAGVPAAAAYLARRPAAPGLAELAGRILSELRRHVQAAARDAHLDVRLVPGDTTFAWASPGTDARAEIMAAGTVQAGLPDSAALVRLPSDADLGVDELVELVEFAWKNTDLGRLQIGRSAAVVQPQFNAFED
jgi:hypothetical protein